jgi:hypothetical protein
MLVDLMVKESVMLSAGAMCLISVISLRKRPKVEAICVRVSIHEDKACLQYD